MELDSKVTFGNLDDFGSTMNFDGVCVTFARTLTQNEIRKVGPLLEQLHDIYRAGPSISTRGEE